MDEQRLTFESSEGLERITLSYDPETQEIVAAGFYEDVRVPLETLVPEVRRLRRENHLLNLSRGVPSVLVGLD